MTDNIVKIGRIISDSEPIGEGINDSFRCVACCGDEEYPVIAKYLKPIEIIKELICSILGRTLNLPIPEPILLLDSKDVFCFGSIDIGYPNLYHFLNSKDPFYLEFHSVIKNWDDIESAAFFDEFIINADRHSGNLLFNGKNIMMIDHGLSIPSDEVNPEFSDNWNNILFKHLLCNFVGLNCNHQLDKNELCNRLNNWCKEITGNALIDKVADKIPVDESTKSELLSFLKKRSKFIANIINNKITPPQMDFVND